MSPESRDQGQPTITVIIAVRNGAATLQSALDSIFEQTLERIEVVIIDGASTDGTQAIIERNAVRIAYWESKPDRGIYHAWNKALDHTTGEWICFLGADDRYHAPPVLERMAAAIAADQACHRIAYGSVHIIRKDGSIRFSGYPWERTRKKFYGRGRMIPHQGTFHHRTTFEQHGRFDEWYRIAGDYEFLLRELLDHEPLFVPEVVADMAAGGLSYRPSSTYRLMREIHRARYTHGLAGAPEWRSPALFRTLSRIWLTRRIGLTTTTRLKDFYVRVFRRKRRKR